MYDIIVAHDSSFGIGKNNELPWEMPQDLERFRSLTTNHRIVMGRRTFESIGKVLPNRTNIVVTSDEDYCPPNVVVCHSLSKAIKDAREHTKTTFVVGGAEIYSQCFSDPLIRKDIRRIYVTSILKDYECDKFFSYNIHKNSEEWKLFNQEKHDEFVFMDYCRVNHEENNFLSLCKEIMSSGENTPTRTGVNTKSLFSRQLRFDLSADRIPVLTTKKVFIRGSIEEMLFFISGSTDTDKLKEKGVNIWNANTTREFLDKRGLQHYEEGDMGPTYPFLFRHAGAEGEYSGKNTDYSGKGIDQISEVIKALKSDEPNRRIMINLWSPAHLDKMSLPPCLFCYIFHKQGKDVSMQAIMRSGDVFLGVPFNILGASIVLRIVCHLSGCRAKELVLDIVDAHIYENHFKQAEIQLSREPYPFPILNIMRSPEEIGDIDGVKSDDFEISGYRSYPVIRGEMAV